jgi:hypothetical protein
LPQSVPGAAQADGGDALVDQNSCMLLPKVGKLVQHKRTDNAKAVIGPVWPRSSCWAERSACKKGSGQDMLSARTASKQALCIVQAAVNILVSLHH